jgi:site-specific DNA recombinase
MERHGTPGKKAASGAHDLSVEYVALYMRVSSEDQAERGTIGAQRDFLRNFAQLYDLTVIDEYADDGVSGAVSLSQRLDGKRLLTDAQAGRFGSVLVYRVDRLGRSLTALLEAHTVLAQAGVTIRSATEPFDTSTPIGTFLFQLLGSLAELEKSTIAERMSMGRNRVAKDGRWTNGPIPFGYDLDQDRRLVPSTRIVPGLDMTEAEAARDIFERIADGSTTVEESRRFNALGVPTARRYSGNVTVKPEAAAKNWLPSRLNYMIRSTVYKGVHVFKSKSGPIERDVPALVDVATWERAQIQLQRNRSLPKGNEKRVYLLRGLITCNTCGANYVGFTSYHSKGSKGHYYRCGAQLGSELPVTLRPRATMFSSFNVL